MGVTGTGPEEVERAAEEALESACQQATPAADDEARPMCRWQRLPELQGGVELVHLHPVRHLAWHGRGDYFASVAPTGTPHRLCPPQTGPHACCLPSVSLMP